MQCKEWSTIQMTPKDNGASDKVIQSVTTVKKWNVTTSAPFVHYWTLHAIKCFTFRISNCINDEISPFSIMKDLNYALEKSWNSCRVCTSLRSPQRFWTFWWAFCWKGPSSWAHTSAISMLFANMQLVHLAGTCYPSQYVLLHLLKKSFYWLPNEVSPLFSLPSALQLAKTDNI